MRRAAAKISAPVRSLCRRLLLLLLATGALVAVVAVVATQAGLARSWLALLVLPTLAPAWWLWAFLRARPPAELELVIGREEQPLRDLCDEVAAAVAVPAVRRVAISTEPRTRLHTDARGVVLLVAGPALWHLHDLEMRKALAPVVASSAVAAQAKMRWAQRLGRRLLSACEATPTVLGWPFRGLSTELSGALAEMERELAKWGRTRAAEHGLDDEPEVDVLAEVWEIFVERFARPSYRRSWVPVEMGVGLHDFVAALDSCRVIDRRQPRRVTGRRVADLLTEAPDLDRSFSRLVAQRLGVDGREVSWAEYPDAVVGSHQRELAAKLVSAVGLVSGEPVAPTMANVIEAVEDKQREVAAALYGLAAPGPDEAEAALVVLEEYLVAFVTTAVVDAGTAKRQLDWVAGHLVVTDEREVVDVSGVVASFVHGSNARLYAWMEWLGLLQTTVQVNGAGARSATVFATGLFGPVLLRGVVADLVRYGDELIVLGDVRRFGWRGLVGVLRQRPWVLELLRRNRTTPVAQLLREMPSSVHIPLDQVEAVTLSARRFTHVWKCVIETEARRVVLRGNIDASVVARVLRAELAHRVTTRGLPGEVAAPGRHAQRPDRPAGFSLRSASAMILRWISEVPSKMVVNRASRQ